MKKSERKEDEVREKQETVSEIFSYSSSNLLNSCSSSVFTSSVGILEEEQIRDDLTWKEIQELNEASKFGDTFSSEQVRIISRNQGKEGSLSTHQGKMTNHKFLVTSNELDSDLSVNISPSFGEVDDFLLYVCMRMDDRHTLVEYDYVDKIVLDCELKRFEASNMLNMGKHGL
uniref:Uncharacterized protein n=1 Tax=Solanum tuberosum TaxID=4113 RepID=M1DSB8_SOLTU